MFGWKSGVHEVDELRVLFLRVGEEKRRGFGVLCCFCFLEDVDSIRQYWIDIVAANRRHVVQSW